MNRRIITSCMALLVTACILLILILAAWLAVFKSNESSPVTQSWSEKIQLPDLPQKMIRHTLLS